MVRVEDIPSIIEPGQLGFDIEGRPVFPAPRTTAELIRAVERARLPTLPTFGVSPARPPPTPGLEPEPEVGLSPQEKARISGEIKQTQQTDLSSLRQQFQRDLRGVRSSQERLDLIQNFQSAQDEVRLRAQLQKVAQGVLKTFTVASPGGGTLLERGFLQVKERLTPERARELLGKDLTEIVKEKFPRVVTGEILSFRDVEPPTQTKIRNFILTLPGGATLLRNVDAGIETLRDIEKKFPTFETFLSKEEKERRRLLEEGLVREDIIKEGIPIRETIAVTPALREATFFERTGIEEDEESKKFKLQVEIIQEQILLDKITEEEAQLRLDDTLEKFVFEKTKKGFPKTVALSIGLFALRGIPVLGPAIGGAIAVNSILQRRRILAFAKRFPKATALNVSGVLAGGLIGNVIAGKISSAINNKIDPNSLVSVTAIRGGQRTTLIKQAQEISPDLKIAFKQKKITGFNTYEIFLKDGRKFRIVEFTKLKSGDLAKGLKGEKNFVGFQTDIIRGQRIVGRGVSVVVDGKAETFISVLRFKPANTPVSRFLQKFGFNRAKVFNILEKSKVVQVKGKTAQVISEARILNIKGANRNLGQRIANLEKKLFRNQRININEIKSLINLDRRASGLKPFTELEFRQAGTPVITESVIRQAINKARITFNQNLVKIKLLADVRSGVLGVAETRPGVFFKSAVLKKAKIVKTPLVDPFDFNKAIAKLWRESKGAGKQKLLSISKQVINLKSRLVGSPSGLALSLARKLEQPKFIPGAVPFVITASAFAGTGLFERTGLRAELEEFFLLGRIRRGGEITETFSEAEARKLFPGFSPAKNPFKVPSGRIESFGNLGKIGNLGALEGRLGTGASSLFNTAINTAQRSFNINKEILLLKNRLKKADSEFARNSLRNRLDSLNRQRNRQRQALIQVQKLGLKLQQRQRQRQALRQRLGQPLRVGQPFRPFVPPPVPLILVAKVVKKKPIKKLPVKKRGEFDVFVRKKGKDIKLKTFRSLPKARKRLKSQLAETLRASGFIVNKRTKQKVKPKITSGFRASKIRKNVLVEIKSKRLDSKLEVKSIQEAKRLKKAFKSDNSDMSKRLKRRKRQ